MRKIDVLGDAPLLDVAGGQLRAELERAAGWVADYLEQVSARPVVRHRSDVEREALASWTPDGDGKGLAGLLGEVQELIAPFPCGNGHPAFFGWINSPPAPAAIIAELIAATLNPSNGMGEHALMDLERGVVAALASLAGLPATTGGVLTSGGSMANLLCLATARSWYLNRLGATDGPAYDDAHTRLVAYQSIDTHMSVAKAARTIGLPTSRLRTIGLDERHRINVAELDAVIQADLAAGLLPFCVVSTCGSTATGAIDPIADITAITHRHGLWHHLDGAFGGLGAAHPDLAPHYLGVAEIDSLTIDPHKTLSTPIGCGAALVTRPERLRQAFTLKASYLDGNADWPWLSDYTIELTRPAGRALTVWAVLRHLGRTGVTELLDHYLTTNQQLRQLITDHPDLELLAGGPWSITCFRYHPAPHTVTPREPADLDTLTTQIAHRLQERGNAFLATVTTRLNGQHVLALRASICNYQTQHEHLHTLINEVLTIGHDLTTPAQTPPRPRPHPATPHHTNSRPPAPELLRETPNRPPPTTLPSPARL